MTTSSSSRFFSGFYADNLLKIPLEFHEIYKQSVKRWANYSDLPISFLDDMPAHQLIHDIALIDIKVSCLEERLLKENKNDTWSDRLEKDLIRFKNQRLIYIKGLEEYNHTKASSVKGKPMRGGWRDRLIKSRKFEEQQEVEKELSQGEIENSGSLQPQE